VDSFRRDLKTFLVLLAYTAHSALCDYALYKSTIDIDIDIGIDIDIRRLGVTVH